MPSAKMQSKCYGINGWDILVIIVCTMRTNAPAERSRHIDIQHFAIQDWKEAGDIIMSFIPGIINPSDDLTKPLQLILSGAGP